MIQAFVMLFCHCISNKLRKACLGGNVHQYGIDLHSICVIRTDNPALIKHKPLKLPLLWKLYFYKPLSKISSLFLKTSVYNKQYNFSLKSPFIISLKLICYMSILYRFEYLHLHIYFVLFTLCALQACALQHICLYLLILCWFILETLTFLEKSINKGKIRKPKKIPVSIWCNFSLYHLCGSSSCTVLTYLLILIAGDRILLQCVCER